MRLEQTALSAVAGSALTEWISMSPGVIYSFPTVEKMLVWLCALIKGDKTDILASIVTQKCIVESIEP